MFNGDSLVSLPRQIDRRNNWRYDILTATDSSVSMMHGKNLHIEIEDYQCKYLPNNYNGSMSLYAEKSPGTVLYVNYDSIDIQQKQINKTFVYLI